MKTKTAYRLQLNLAGYSEIFNEVYYNLNDACEAALQELERIKKVYPDFDQQLKIEKQKDLAFNEKWAHDKCRFILELCKYVNNDIEPFKFKDFNGVKNLKEFSKHFKTSGWCVSRKSFWFEMKKITANLLEALK
jgi:hypothetical protein